MISRTALRVTSHLALICGAAAAALVASPPGQAQAAGASSVRVPGADNGFQWVLSGNARFVAFSAGPVAGKQGHIQVYETDRNTGASQLISAVPKGSPGNDNSYVLSVSANGRYVLFTSEATNIVPNDTNHWDDLFLRDTTKKVTTRVSVSKTGAQLDSNTLVGGLSPDGRFVTFQTNADNVGVGPGSSRPYTDNIYLRNLASGAIKQVSVASGGGAPDGNSDNPQVSNGGRFVVFDSTATNLVPRGTKAYPPLVYVRDMRTGRTRLVSVGLHGARPNEASGGATISDNGRFIAYRSFASNIVRGDRAMCTDPDNGPYNCADVFVRDMKSGRTVMATVSSSGRQANQGGELGSISGNGRYVAYQSGSTNLVPGDTNGQFDVFVRDLTGHTTRRVSVTSAGKQIAAGGEVSRDVGQQLSTTGSAVTFLVPLAPPQGGIFVRSPLH